MARYFHFMAGLRGGYMPDHTSVIRCDTRRELRSAIAYECNDMREAYGYGAPAREITAVAAALWRDKTGRGSPYGLTVGFGRTRDTSDRPFGLTVSAATKAEYDEHQAQEF